jgi:hypothetical protein
MKNFNQDTKNKLLVIDLNFILRRESSVLFQMHIFILLINNNTLLFLQTLFIVIEFADDKSSTTIMVENNFIEKFWNLSVDVKKLYMLYLKCRLLICNAK